MTAGYAVLRALNEGRTVNLNDSGVLVRALAGDLQPGDTYVAARNTVNLLTVKLIDFEHGQVVAKQAAYAFDTFECVRVEIVSAPGGDS